MRHQWRLDPRPHGPAVPSRELVFDAASGRSCGVVTELGAGQTIRGPGIAGGPVIEPAVEGIADAGAHRARHLHRILVRRRADRRRCQAAGAGHIAGKRYVGLDPDQEARPVEDVVAALEAAEIAALAGVEIEAAEQVERAREIGGLARLRRREIGPSRRKAGMGARVETGPVIGWRGRGHRHGQVGGTGAAGNKQRGHRKAGTQLAARSRRDSAMRRPGAAPQGNPRTAAIVTPFGGMHAHAHILPASRSFHRSGRSIRMEPEVRALVCMSFHLDAYVRLPTRG